MRSLTPNQASVSEGTASAGKKRLGNTGVSDAPSGCHNRGIAQVHRTRSYNQVCGALATLKEGDAWNDRLILLRGME